MEQEENKKMKQVLIIGENSYIGRSFEDYILHTPKDIEITKISSRNNSWVKYDFSKYDSVLNVAGIAHADISKVSDEQKKVYFEVNAELPYELAKKAKKEGVKQFIYLSSSIVYGDSSFPNSDKEINAGSVPQPSNFYGESKLLGEKKVCQLKDESFNIVILRLPMVYGYGSKGNFPKLWKIAQILPIFPRILNKRSMLYIKNLCEFIRLVIINEENGIFYPQNKEISSTSQIVMAISKAMNKKVFLVKKMNFFIECVYHIPLLRVKNLIMKSFGTLYYDSDISTYDRGLYQIYSLEESIMDIKRMIENR